MVRYKPNKRGQAVAEFLYTYGWVMLAVSAILVTMSYMGLANYSFFEQDRCVFNGGLECRDFTYEEGTFQILVRNQMGYSVYGVNITIDGTACSVLSSNLTYTMHHNDERAFYIPCNLNSGTNELDLIATFSISETNNNYTKVGKLITTYRE